MAAAKGAAAPGPAADDQGAAPVKVCTGLAQTLGQLQASNRYFHSNCWVNLKLLGQPCELEVVDTSAMHLCTDLQCISASPRWCKKCAAVFDAGAAGEGRCVVGRGHVSLLTDLKSWHSKPSRGKGHPLIYSPTKCSIGARAATPSSCTARRCPRACSWPARRRRRRR